MNAYLWIIGTALVCLGWLIAWVLHSDSMGQSDDDDDEYGC